LERFELADKALRRIALRVESRVFGVRPLAVRSRRNDWHGTPVEDGGDIILRGPKVEIVEMAIQPCFAKLSPV